MSQLRTDLEELPRRPGVYLMKDASGAVLYVGKAEDLRARVRQYFQRSEKGDGRFHVAFLVPRIQDVEVIVTTSPREALILEDTLIKKHQPRYNVRLKDDKSWLSMRLDPKEKWPRPTLVRRWKDDGARYFGPYLDELNSRKVQRLLSRTVPLRTCSDAVFRAHSERPCIEHQMGRCAAPCVGYINRVEYAKLVDEAVLLLEGRTRTLQGRLKERMEAASAELRYEDAGRIRDNIRLLQRLGERQSAQVPGLSDRDVFGLHREGQLAAVTILPIREGRMQDVRAFDFRSALEEDDEFLGRLIAQIYSPTVPAPGEILVPCAIDDSKGRAELLSEVAGRRVRIVQPRRGAGKRLIDIARENAQVRFRAAHSRAERAEQALFGIQRALHMDRLPRRIECYDNSNIQGSDPVGAMVTFKDGVPWKKGYRTFQIKGVSGPDDYATMKEVLLRRLKRSTSDDPAWALPELILIDGGRGQLAQVVAVCHEIGLALHRSDAEAPTAGVHLAAIAKPRPGEPTDKVYQPGRANPVALRARNPGLHLLQQLRDEAHRFAVRYHRKRRTKRTLSSELDSIPGVGPATRKRLLRHFGSIQRIRAASLTDLGQVQGVGPRTAEAIQRSLATGS